MNLSPGLESVVFKRILVVVRDTHWVAVIPWNSSRLPPTVTWRWWISFLSGRIFTTILPNVTVLLFGTLVLSIKISVVACRNLCTHNLCKTAKVVGKWPGIYVLIGDVEEGRILLGHPSNWVHYRVSLDVVKRLEASNIWFSRANGT